MNKQDINPPSTFLRTFSSLRIPSYRLFFGALLGQMAAMNMQMVARSWFMYELTGKASMLGLVALAGAIPMLGLSLFGGVIADRVAKKRVLIIGQFCSSLVAFGIALFITFGSISWFHLVLASILQGSVASLMMPSRQAIIHELVGEDELMNAIALNTAAMNLLRLLAPAFAGFFIALWSIEGVYYIMGGLYLTGFSFAIFFPDTHSERSEEVHVFRELMDGLRYIRSNLNIFILLMVTLCATILSMPYMFLLPIFAKDIFIIDLEGLTALTSLPIIGDLVLTLEESSVRQGLLVSISGIGALTGSLVVAGMHNRRRGLYLLISLLVVGLSLAIFSFTESYLLAMVMFIPLGLGQAGRMALSNTLLQSYTEDTYRGRVMSVYMMEFGVTFVGVFLIGLLSDFIGVQAAVGGAAIVLVFAAAAFLIFVPRIRNLD